MSNIEKSDGRILKEISNRAWEHPADRAALATLKQVPGLPDLTRKLIGVTTEKSLWLLNLASSVRVGEQQFPRINKLYNIACERLDVVDRPELFVSQNPFLNAGAIGADHPFIVINSASLGAFDDAELIAMLGHEIGHCVSGHVLFKTLLQFLVKIPFGMIQIPAAGVALAAIIAALNEWNRKSELSADRAGLLAVQQPEAAFTLLMKMAGGADLSQMNMNEFLNQAKQYHESGDLLSGAHKLINVLGQSHPYPVARLSEIKSWVDSGKYQRILDGDYPTRDAKDETLKKEWTEATDQFREDLRNANDPISNLADNVFTGIDDLADQVKGVFGTLFTDKK